MSFGRTRKQRVRRWCIRVFHFEPALRSTAAIARTEALADDPLEPELACMPEHHIAGLVDMLVEVQCPACFAQELRELALAVRDRRATQVLASSSSRSKANSTASVLIARS